MKKILALSVAMAIGQMLAISAHAQAIGVDDKAAARAPYLTYSYTLFHLMSRLDSFSQDFIKRYHSVSL